MHLLRKKDGSRVKQQYIAVNDGKPVARADLTKGFAYAKDRYVQFSPAELKSLEEGTTHSVEISRFVPLESMDPLYFAGTYFLVPERGGSKPYALLATALARTKQCAIGRWISRGKENLVVIRPLEDGLAMHHLHFDAEMLSMKPLAIQPARISEPELKLAQQLIEHLAAKRFDPKEYRDEVKDRVKAAIERKVNGKEITLAEAPASQSRANVIDLMAALRSSLGARAPKSSSKERPLPRCAETPPPPRAARR